MGKHEAMTPKAIAKKIKAKGLQKLRWYCQMCQKQCRDENGFKCHCMSESHQRQMQIFGQNSGKFVSDFSREFEKSFMDYMKRSYRHTRVLANVVYNELIKDRNHVHMNSTRWTSLSGFCQYLGKTGKCKIEDSPKGWYLTYIDNDPETQLKQGLKRQRITAEAEGEERRMKQLELQIQKAWQRAEEQKQQNGLLQRDEENGGKVAFSLSSKKVGSSAGTSNPDGSSSTAGAMAAEEDEDMEADESEEEGAGNEEEDDEHAEEVAEEEAATEAEIQTAGLKHEAGEESAYNTAPEPALASSEALPGSSSQAGPAASEALAASDGAGKPSNSVKPVPAMVAPAVSLTFKIPASGVISTTSKKAMAVVIAGRPPVASKNGGKQRSAMEELMLEEERAREKKNRKDNWLCEGIVVKVLAKNLANGAYYKKKGVVKRLESKFVGEIHMLDTGHLLKVDQEQLETVIPQVGGLVRVVNGAYRGCNARLLSVDMDKFSVSVQVDRGPFDGRIIPSVAYEDISKLDTS